MSVIAAHGLGFALNIVLKSHIITCAVRTVVFIFPRTIRDWNYLERLSRSKLMPQSPVDTSCFNAMHSSANGQSPLLGTYRSTEVVPIGYGTTGCLFITVDRDHVTPHCTHSYAWRLSPLPADISFSRTVNM